MKVKPKDIKVNLPTVMMFDDYHEIPAFVVTINSIVHGKVKVKCEELGLLSGRYVGIFYLQRNNEYQALREEFKSAIEQEEIERFSRDTI